MKRRRFIQTGFAACGWHGLTRKRASAEVLSGADSIAFEERMCAGMMWSEESIPVPLLSSPHTTSKFAPTPLPPEPVTPWAPVTADLHSVFRANFIVPSGFLQVTLHLFAFTRYRLYVNGAYVGRGPSRYQNQGPEYDRRDISKLMKGGRNSIAVLVHRDAPTGRIMSHTPGMTALLMCTESHGKVSELVPEDGWRSVPDRSFLPRHKAWSSISENLDARQGVDWAAASFDSSGWPLALSSPFKSVRLTPRITPLERETPVNHSPHPALPVAAQAPAELTLEIGHVVQAYLATDFEAVSGSKIECRFELPDGTSTGTNTLITRDGRQNYISGDTYACSRIRLRLLQGSLTWFSTEVVEVLYPFDVVGAFLCDDPLLEHLWHISTRTAALLSEDAYVDCADRERVEWMDCTPPAFEVTHVTMAGPSVHGVNRRSDTRLLKALLRRIALTQMPDGQVRALSCSDRWDVHTVMEDRSCDFVVAARQHFDFIGDSEFVRELWPVIVRLCDWYLSRKTARGLVLGREWEVWDNPLRYQTCEGTGLNSLVCMALRDAAFLGKVIGSDSEAARLQREADALTLRLNDLLWNQSRGSYNGALFGAGSQIDTVRGVRLEGLDAGVYPPTMQAALFALYSGIVPSSRLAEVQRFVRSHKDELAAVMSHYYLFRALYDMETPEAEADVLNLLRERWKTQIESPWQTTWETFDPTVGSKVHIYGTLPAYFLSVYVLGVQCDGKQMVISPRCGDLQRASGTVMTSLGLVEISWNHVPEGLHIRLTLPTDTNAELRILKWRSKNGKIEISNKVVQSVSRGDYWTVQLRSSDHEVMVY